MFNLIPTDRRIAQMVSNAVFLARKKRRGTNWRKTIEGEQGRITVLATFPGDGSGPKLFGTGPLPSWEVFYETPDKKVIWRIKRRPNGAISAYTLEGTVPRKLSSQTWDDLHAILPHA